MNTYYVLDSSKHTVKDLYASLFKIKFDNNAVDIYNFFKELEKKSVINYKIIKKGDEIKNFYEIEHIHKEKILFNIFQARISDFSKMGM